MPWFSELDRDESGLELRTGEIEELENDELELREAAFMEGYIEAGLEEYYESEDDVWE
ncbi:hypothetical protein HYV82_01585 [Candidatus Woesearchaeota archaeon]|nr:hypothetical protein [Candidatus Woesearchaeota archaeon]